MDSLNILWTTDNKETFLHMINMYVVNAKKNGWWRNIRLIVWGASARLLATDVEVQKLVKIMQDEGIVVQACRSCAENLKVLDILESLDIEVKAMGLPFTEYLKSGQPVITI